MRVCCIYDVEGWAHHRRCVALKKYAPPDIAVDLYSREQLASAADGGYDVALLLCYGLAGRFRKMLDARNATTRLAVGFNVGWGYRRDRLEPLLECSDRVVLNNYENWHRQGRLPKTTWISNGTDLELFHVARPFANRPPKVIWSGSRYHNDHNDDLKGRGLLEAIEPRLAEKGIQWEWLEVDSHGDPRRKTLPEMMEWYNSAKCYVCASTVEGTPNPLLEAAACGCVPCSTRVGNATELIRPGINGELVDRTEGELFEGICRCVKWHADMAPRLLTDIQRWAWQDRAREYYTLFRRMVAGN